MPTGLVWGYVSKTSHLKTNDKSMALLYVVLERT
jgi:hypothetical protein